VRDRGRTSSPPDTTVSEQPIAEVGADSDIESLSGERVSARVAPVEWALYGAFFVIGALMRFWDLGSRALHHDESLHTTYSWYLWERLTGTNAGAEYHYDPMMHGPYQFHGNALMYLIFGPSVASARLNAAVCGTILFLLPFLLRRQIGRVSALILSALLAFSPAFLYYSRFTREDIYFALFTAVFFIGFMRWLDAHGRPNGHRWLYMTAAGFAACWATKESTFFILLPTLLGFLLLVVVAGYAYQFLAPRRSTRAPQTRQGQRGQAQALQQPARPPAHPLVEALGDFSRANLPAVIGAFRGVPALAWLACLGIIAAITIFLFWPVGDPVAWGFIPFAHTVPTTLHTGASVNYSTDGIFGGVQYWFLQQGEARGTQPWYYYFLVIPLYEQVGVVFGAAGLVYYFLHASQKRAGVNLALISGGLFVAFTLLTLFLGPTLPKALYELLALLMIVSGVVLLLSRPRSPLINFLLWWTVTTWGLYTFAGEKMPWLTVHIMLPTYMVAALYLGHLFTARRLSRTWIIALVGLALTAAISFRSSVALAYADGANPTEMLIYTQTSQDVPMVSNVIHQMRAARPTDSQVWADGSDSWPLVWYLHDLNPPYSFGGSESDHAGAISGVTTATSQRDAFVIVGAENHDYMRDNGGKLSLLSGYTGYEFRFRWWFPEEDYKAYENTGGLSAFLSQAIQPSTWGNLINWWATRTPFNQTDFHQWNNVYRFYVYVRSDLAPHYIPASWSQLAATPCNGDTWCKSPLQRAADDSHYTAPATTPNDVPDSQTVPAPSQALVNGSLLNQPIGVARAVAVGHDGSVYVTDSSAQRVVKLDAGGHYVTSWGGPGAANGQFGTKFPNANPMGITVGPDGNVYVSDTWNQRVQVFSPAGVFLRAFGRSNPTDAAGNILPFNAPDQFYGPRQIAVAPNGNLYVADTGNERIQVYSPRGVHLFNIGQGDHNPQTRPGYVFEPSGVAIDRHGVVYVADYWDKRVQRFTLTGAYLGQYPISGWAAQDYNEPYLAVDDNGRLFATDAPGAGNVHVNHVLELDAATGRLIHAFGGRTTGALKSPSGIAVGPNGALYIADSGTAQVFKVRP